MVSFQTVAALKYYGLVSYIGSKDRRQLKLTDDARRLFLNECPEVHLKIFKKLAIAPQAFANLWRHWKTDPPSDTVARSTLKVEFGYAEKAASELLTLYKTNLSFAKLTEGGDDSLAAGPEISAGEQLEMATDPPGVAIGVGDYVQWTSNGQDQFPSPQRVAWVSEDGTHARVFGSMTGIPTSELAMANPSKPTQWSKPRSADRTEAGLDSDLNVLLRGNRLEISADVDREGLQKLKAILSKYEEILALIDPPKQGEAA